jgi:hypothetical protein
VRGLGAAVPRAEVRAVGILAADRGVVLGQAARDLGAELDLVRMMRAGSLLNI